MSLQWFRQAAKLSAPLSYSRQAMRRLQSFHQTPLKALSQIFPSVSDIFLPCSPFQYHLIPNCLVLLESRRPPTASSSSSLSQSSSPPLFLLLFLRLIWCNYLITPTFVTHLPGLAFLSYPCPSSLLGSNVPLTCVSMFLPLWRSQFNSR